MSTLRGAARLAVTATREGASVVEAMHRAIGGPPALLAAPVYAAIRGIASLVGAGVEKILDVLPVEMSGEHALISVLNGVVGDHLVAEQNPLAIEMSLRAPAERTAKIVLMVHGLCMSEQHWLRDGHDHGAALARDHGYTPVYARYNSGLPIAQNGRDLAEQIGALLDMWPVPVESIAIIGHSMGGLVARAALNEDASWRPLVRLVTLGTPHRGAPLEVGGAWLEHLLGISRYSAPLVRLGQMRSAGIMDLRHGSADPLTVPALLVAGSADGMVPVASAHGIDSRGSTATGSGAEWRCGSIEADRRVLVERAGHIDLISSPIAYAAICEWLTSA